VSAPEALRAKYRRMATPAMIAALQRSRPSGHVADPEYMTLLTLKTLADLPGVGPDVASQLLITVGDNRGRILNEARFAALVGVAPIPASSGKTTRHRLSRGCDRKANRALHHSDQQYNVT
jgi:transposase